MFRFLMSGLSAGLLVSSVAVANDIAPDKASFSSLQKFEAGRIPESMHGIWQSQGYGWLFDISDEGVRQYQIAGEYCFASPSAEQAMTDTLALSYQYYRTSSSPDAAILQLLPDDTEIHIRRVMTLPAICQSDLNWSREAVLDYVAELIETHYAFKDLRSIDWPARVQATNAQLSEDMDDEQFFDLVAGLIDGFSDSHTKLIGTVNGERRKQQDGLGETLSTVRAKNMETPWLIGLFSTLQEDILDPGSEHTANDRILWGMIEDRIGYIQILQMGGFSGVGIGDPEFRVAEFAVFDEIMDRALAQMQDAEFVILDLSNNRGGYDAISRRLAGRFTQQRFVGYTTHVPGSGVPARERMIEPTSGLSYTGPVILLTSDVTVSGGEIATLALRELPNVTHVGTTTRGSFSTVLSKPLPNGWVLELSNEVIATPDGTVYEEVGILPEIEMSVFPQDALIEGHKSVIDAIVADAPNF